MGDLSNIIDMLKDFKTFGKNIVELFRGIPDLFIDLGSLGDKETGFDKVSPDNPDEDVWKWKGPKPTK